MSENTYEYECMRAELLGIEKPDYEEYMKNHPEELRQKQVVEDEEIDTENLKEIDIQDGSVKNVAGGLDELNTILKATQKKLNSFKTTACGSLTNIFSSRSNSIQEQVPPEIHQPKLSENIEKNSENSSNEKGTSQPRKSDLTKALDNHVDRLDSLIDKAEEAQYSMAHQNKQMKKFLKK